jgi:hypothetical protein
MSACARIRVYYHFKNYTIAFFIYSHDHGSKKGKLPIIICLILNTKIPLFFQCKLYEDTLIGNRISF